VTSTAVAPLSRAVTLGRVAAPVALASATVHLALLDPSSLTSLLMLAMAAVCLPCAWHQWRLPTAAVWRMTAVVDAVMLVAHVQMLGGAGTGPHLHTGPQPLMWLGLGLVVAQLALAGSALLCRRSPPWVTAAARSPALTVRRRAG
jgi:hypothetical protein